MSFLMPLEWEAAENILSFILGTDKIEEAEDAAQNQPPKLGLNVFEVSSLREARAAAERVRRKIAAQPVKVAGHGEAGLTVSIGVAYP